MFDIDIAMFIGFLILNIIVGFVYSTKIKTIEDYALGGRNFSTAALTSTIVATCVTGSGFFISLSKTYTDGLYYFIPAIFIIVQIFITVYVLIPRMGEFLGSTSIAQTMGELYGEEIRLITAICGILKMVGGIAVQFKVFGEIFHYFIGMDADYAVILASVIVIIYSSFGGIKAVTYTDILQFITFGFVVPLIGLVLWNHISSEGLSIYSVQANPNFDYEKVFRLNNPRLWEMIPLMLYFIMPSTDPTSFQRIAMGKNINQAKKAWFVAAILFSLVTISLRWISLLVKTIAPNLKGSEVINYLIDNYAFTGMKGLMIIGIAAMAMSTADSRINAAAVLFANDIGKTLKIKINYLFLSKIFSLLLGVFATYLALSKTDLLSMVMTSASFYLPVVTVPLLLAIFGFRSTKVPVLIGMVTGFSVVLAGNIFKVNADTIMLGMLVNLVCFMGSHYILKQPGGWVARKNNKQLSNIHSKKKKKELIITAVKNFSFSEFCKKIAPKNEIMYMWFGVYCILYTLTTMYSTQVELLKNHGKMILTIYQIMMVTGVVFAMYPIWPVSIKHKIKIQIVWLIAVFYMLILFSCFFVMVSNFGPLQFAVFILNMLIAAVLVGWKIGLAMAIGGFYLSIKCYKYYSGLNSLNISIGSSQLVLMYALMMVGTALVIFLKPKQEEQEIAEAKAVNLGEQVQERDKELERSLAVKNEFLRNLRHEAVTPITGITSMGQALLESYDKLNETQKKSAVETIARSSNRLHSLVSNMIDLSKLSSMNYQLNKEQVNISDLAHERLAYCRKTYLEGKDLEFFSKIPENIILNCDPYYIRSTLDNLIINAIQYSQHGVITLELHDKGDVIEFSIADEGVGIPKEEVFDIFYSFTVSSRTKTPSGGRGIGLALCKKAIESHGGEIWAESDGEKGARFVFTLPKISS